MPRGKKISPATRKGWVDAYEQGERIDKLARDAGRTERTIKEHIERARQERDFELAQREQLREALRAHQDDMQGLLKRIRRVVHVPPVDFVPSLAADFGQADPRGRPKWEVSLPLEEGQGHAVTVIVHGGSPAEIRLPDEGSRLWRALKEHIGNKDPLWRDIADWRGTLLKELQARAALNRAIRRKAEVSFSLPVLAGAAVQEPHLTSALAPFVRRMVTRLALGMPVSDFVSGLVVRGGSVEDPTTATFLTEGVAEAEKVKEGLPKMIEGLARSPEAEGAARTHRDLEARTRKARGALEEYVLLHYIRGRCSLCRKLGGQ